MKTPFIVRKVWRCKPVRSRHLRLTIGMLAHEETRTVVRENGIKIPTPSSEDCPNVVPAGSALLKSKVFPNCFLLA
jgi:hypothetical protein